MPKFYIESKDLKYVVHHSHFVIASCLALRHFLNTLKTENDSNFKEIGHHIIVTEFGFISKKTSKQKKEIKYKEKKKVIKNVTMFENRAVDSIIFLPTKQILDIIGYEVSLDEDSQQY